MQITLELPDDVAQGLEAQVKNLPRALLESFALEGYRSGKLTEEQVRRILGYGTRMQVHGFLKEHDVYLNYGLEDLEQDMQTLRQVRARDSMIVIADTNPRWRSCRAELKLNSFLMEQIRNDLKKVSRLRITLRS